MYLVLSLDPATLLPNYTFYLLFLGPVRIKYIALFYILLSFLDVTGSNAGGEIAHLGGAMIGYLFIRQLQNGVNIGEGVINIVNFFNKEKNKKSDQKSSPTEETKHDISQDEIDKILDKISESGYSSLSKNEKEKLFNASKKNEGKYFTFFSLIFLGCKESSQYNIENIKLDENMAKELVSFHQMCRSKISL